VTAPVLRVYVAPGAGASAAGVIDDDRRVATAADAAVIVADPPALAAGLGRGARTIALLAMVDPHALLAPGAFDWVGLRADAYATTRDGLREALAAIDADDPAARVAGPLRVTYRGSLGQPEPYGAGPAGRSFSLATPLIVGRSTDCGIVLRLGPHSDQNTVARRHAELSLAPGGVRVRCLGSTNGTSIDGVRVTGETIAPPGAELAFACTHRFRIDGTLESNRDLPGTH
jgi:hypothetical protein